VFLSEQLHLLPQQFFVFFMFTISGIMAGAWVSGRVAVHAITIGRTAGPLMVSRRNGPPSLITSAALGILVTTNKKV
jgi:hypothetical protein